MNIADSETQLGIRFPAKHREALLNLADPIHERCDFLLLDSQFDGLRLVEVNQFLHSPGTSFSWPSFLVAFASNGCGDYFAYDVRNAMRVMYVDPDLPIADNLSSEDKLEFETFDQWYEWKLRRDRSTRPRVS